MPEPFDTQSGWPPARPLAPELMTSPSAAMDARCAESTQEAPHLVDQLRSPAELDPAAIAYRFLGHDGETLEEWSRGEADRRAREIAACLQAAGLRGERILLVFDPGLEFVSAFLGCLYAGATAVPLYPPDPYRLERTLIRLRHVAQDACAKGCLTTSTWEGTLGRLRTRQGEPIRTWTVDQLPASRNAWDGRPSPDEQLAFLQYTSGSTGEPKGVMISHGNLRRHLRQIHQLVDQEDAVIVSWLPVYHDMGLIAGVLQPWFSGRLSVLMSPLSFFQRPIRWLKAMERHRATTTVAPDFAYDLCARKTKEAERADLDLSRWTIAMNGSEPIRESTMERFTAAFAPAGFRREVFLPCYGLAEGTLMVTGAPPARGPVLRTMPHSPSTVGIPGAATSIRRAAGSGQVLDGWEIAIVDPHAHHPLGHGAVGEVWIRGASAARGYWNQPRLSQLTFQAYTAAGHGPYLRTGDLGFFEDGELFITGRLKELLIVRGKNHSPHEVELTIEQSHPWLKPHSGAVFAVDNGDGERVIAVQEVRRPRHVNLDEVLTAIAAEVMREHHWAPHEIVLIEAGTLPKTTSGKIQRLLCRELYLQGGLRIVRQWKPQPSQDTVPRSANYVAPRNEVEAWLVEVWQEMLGVERVGIHDHFLDLGGHSVLAAQMAHRLEHCLKDPISLRELFDAPTVALLAERIDQRLATSGPELALLLDRVEGLDDTQVAAMLRDTLPG